ncbi:MAG: TIM barrel protein [Candidatus Zixiibacteriota bacterium]
MMAIFYFFFTKFIYIMPMIKHYRIGISSTLDYSVPIERLFEIFSKTGYDFISLGADMEHSNYLRSDKFHKILDLSKSLSLKIESVHIPFGKSYNIANINKSLQRKAMNAIDKFMLLTNQYQIPTVIIHPHHYFPDSRDNCLFRARDALQEILSLKPKNIQMAVENLPTDDGSWICAGILDRLDKSQVGFCYDSSHENMSGRPFHLLEKYFSRLTTSHLSDNHGNFDEHLVPQDGTIDWNGLKSYFDRSDIDHILLEVGTGAPLSLPIERVAKIAYERAQRIFNED